MRGFTVKRQFVPEARNTLTLSLKLSFSMFYLLAPLHVGETQITFYLSSLMNFLKERPTSVYTSWKHTRYVLRGINPFLYPLRYSRGATM